MPITITTNQVRYRAYLDFVRQTFPEIRTYQLKEYAIFDPNYVHTAWNTEFLGPEPTEQDLIDQALAEVKTLLLEGLENQREVYERNGLDLGGGQFDLSRSAISHLGSMLALTGFNGFADSEVVAWPKLDGSYAQLTLGALRNAAGQIFDHINKGQIRCRQLQQDIAALTDFSGLEQVVDDINAFDTSGI